MTRARLLFCLLGITSALSAQTVSPEAEPVVRGEPVIVEEARLTADASGATRVRLDSAVAPVVPSMSNLSGRVANLHVNTGGAGSFGDLFSLRGITNTPYFSDPSVTVYFDDLPLGSSFTYPTGLFGFGTAGIYRGPQGTAFGRAGSGGVLQFQSFEAGPVAQGEFRGSIGNYDARSLALTARSARGDNADAIVSASFNDRSGYITNTTLGIRVDDFQSSAVSARVRVRPSATSELSVQVVGSWLDNGAQPLTPLGGPLFSVARGREGETGIKFGGIAVKGAFDTTLGRLTATTSHTRWDMDPFTNRLDLPPTLDSSITQKQRAWNEEIRLASNRDSALPWEIGLWLSDTRTDGDVLREIPGLFPIEGSSFRLDTETAALFGHVNFLSSGPWRVTGGLRVEHVRKEFDRTQTIPSPGHFTGDDTFNSLLPKVTASYAISADTTASASISAGTKAGGWSAFTGNQALAHFDPERLVAFETGVDTALANKTVKLAARAFYYDIRDYQIERSFTQTDYLVVNAPRARSIGGELEATWHPVQEWNFSATVGLTNVTLERFTDPFSGTNYSGRRAPYAPSYDVNLSATYRHPTGWFAGAELTLVGKTFYDESEDAAFAQGARETVNARAGYETSRWRVSVFGENLTDESYYTLIIPGVGHGSPGAPRTYGVEAAVKW